MTNQPHLHPVHPVTDVIFRVWKRGGDVIALFPALLGTNMAYTCESYEHVGQHSAAYPGTVRDTRPATPAEYADLKAELEGAPYHYNLKVVKRFASKYYGIRQAELQRLKG